MRILMVLGKATGGIGVHVDTLTADLRARGHQVAIATDALTAATFGWDGAHLVWPHGRDPRRLAASWRTARQLARGADVVHAHGHQAGAWAASFAGRRPLVVSLHNNVLAGPSIVSDGAQRWVAWRAALVTGASSDLVDVARSQGARAAELAPVPSPRVPALLEAPAFDAATRLEAGRALLAGLGVDAGLPLVLAVARIAPQKRIDVLLDVARDLRGEAAVAVAGSADEELLGRIRARDTSGDLHILGPRRDLDTLYGTASVLVLTSSWEARALVVQEAMAAGLPVVATDTGGIPDLLRVGGDVVGRLVPVGDAVATARAVRELLADARLRDDLAARGREVARTWPDRDATTRSWEERYARVLG
ncbi:MAG: glycosyltransferase family 4 protein [Actinomycetota bacterium]